MGAGVKVHVTAPYNSWVRVGVTREFKSREVAQRQNNSVISCFIRSLVLNTLIYSATLAPHDDWSGALQSGLC